MTSIEKWGVAEGHAPFFDVVTERVGRGCRTGEPKRDRSTSVPRSPQKQSTVPGASAALFLGLTLGTKKRGCRGVPCPSETPRRVLRKASPDRVGTIFCKNGIACYPISWQATLLTKGDTMAHVEKYNRAQAGHLVRHNIRDKDEHGNYISFGRSKVDETRTALNYRLDGDEDPRKKLERRLSQIKVQKRADVKVYCSWVVTMPPEVQKNEERKFFESTYRFLCDRYGEKNVVCASVHNDETTPHLHFAFVPAVIDKKHPEREKCSAKEVLTPRDLKSFHPDLKAHVERDLGHSVSILLDDRDHKKELSNLDQRDLQKAIEKAEGMVVGVPRTLTEASATKATREANRQLIERAAVAETALREADRQKRQAEAQRKLAEERLKTAEAQRVQLATEAQKQKTIIEQLTRLVTEVGRLAPAILTKARDAVLVQMKQERQAKPKKDVQR